jgi:two-component system response regulator (stage 0 sporulation protein F)
MLIVEDDNLVRRALVRCFSSDEVEVADLADGRDALDYLTASRPDLIVCDLRLPGADGLSVLQWLHQHPPVTPFILITAHGSEQVTRLAVEGGAIAVFEKPFDLDRLKRCCEPWLRGGE